jgi:lysozyme
LEAEKVQKADRHVEFVEYDDQRTLKTDRREIELPVSYFNGGRQEWQKY